jgi:hypothetical protein
MARIFIDGFENGSFDNWDVGSSGSVSNVIIDGFKGVYSASLAGSYGTLIKTFSTSYNELYIAFKVYPYGDGPDNRLLTFCDSSYTEIAEVSYNRTSHFLELRRGICSGTLLATGTTAIEYRQTHLIEVHYKPLNSGGVFTVKIDGNEDVTYSGDTTLGLENIKRIIFAATAYGNFNGNYDDIIVDDANWIGNTYVQKGQVTGAGTTTQWTPSAGSNYQNVDEIPSSNTDYNSTNTTGHIDTFAVSDMTGTITAVKAVQLEMMASYEGTPTPTHLQLGVRSGGTDYFDTDNSPALSFGRFTKILEHNPNGDVDWTESTVNAMEIGYKATA